MADARVRGAVITTGVPTVSARVRAAALREADADAITARAALGEAEAEAFLDAIEGDADSLTATAALSEAEGEAFHREGEADAITATAALGEAEGEVPLVAADADAITATAALGRSRGRGAHRYRRRGRLAATASIGEAEGAQAITRAADADSLTATAALGEAEGEAELQIDYQSFNLGPNAISFTTVWEGALLINPRFVDGGGTAYLRYFGYDGVVVRMYIADSPTAAPLDPGPALTEQLLQYVGAVQLIEEGGDSHTIPGPDHADNQFRDPTEPYTWNIGTLNDDFTGFVQNLGSGSLTLRLADGLVLIIRGDADAITATAALGEAEGEASIAAADADAHRRPRPHSGRRRARRSSRKFPLTPTRSPPPPA